MKNLFWFPQTFETIKIIKSALTDVVTLIDFYKEHSF